MPETITVNGVGLGEGGEIEGGSHLYIFRLRRNYPNESLGLSLSGNVNLNKTSVFVCAIYKDSIAHRHGLIKVGDQILEINGQVIYGRAHSNVTPMIRNMKDLDVYLVILRSDDNLNQMYKPTYQQIASHSSSSSPSNSVNNRSPPELSLSTSTATASQTHQSSLSIQAPLALVTGSITHSDASATVTRSLLPLPQSPTSAVEAASAVRHPIQALSSSSSSNTRVVRKILLKKGPTGFGIAISEDRYNRLIVRGLNPNGVAFQDGRMQVGDEILAVNESQVNQMKYDDVMGLLHTTNEPVEFQVAKADILTTTTTGSSSVPSVCGSSEPSRVNSPSMIRGKALNTGSSVKQSHLCKTNSSSSTLLFLLLKTILTVTLEKEQNILNLKSKFF